MRQWVIWLQLYLINLLLLRILCRWSADVLWHVKHKNKAELSQILNDWSDDRYWSIGRPVGLSNGATEHRESRYNLRTFR